MSNLYLLILFIKEVICTRSSYVMINIMLLVALVLQVRGKDVNIMVL